MCRHLLLVIPLTLAMAEVRADFMIINGDPNQVPMAGMFCGPYVDYVAPSPSMDVEHLAPPSAGDTFTTIFNQDITEYPNWTLSYGPALNGTLTVSSYDAYVDENRGGGGVTMVATYSPAASDPTGLTFVQYYSSSIPDGQPGGGTHIDPYGNDDSDPMYYTAAERAANGLTFSDTPFDPCPGAGSVNNQFYTYLASFNPTTKVLTTYDGWKWGSSFSKAFGAMDTLAVATVPEPSSIIGLCFGGATLITWNLLRRPRGSKIHTNL